MKAAEKANVGVEALLGTYLGKRKYGEGHVRNGSRPTNGMQRTDEGEMPCGPLRIVFDHPSYMACLSLSLSRCKDSTVGGKAVCITSYFQTRDLMQGSCMRDAMRYRSLIMI